MADANKDTPLTVADLDKALKNLTRKMEDALRKGFDTEDGKDPNGGLLILAAAFTGMGAALAEMRNNAVKRKPETTEDKSE